MLAGTRIIIVIGNMDMGGAERQALLLAKYLRKEESADVEVWGIGAPGPIAKACDEAGLPWRLVPLHWYGDRKSKIKQLARLWWALRRARPEVILSYLIVPNVACGLIWRFTGARVCIWNQRCTGTDRLGHRVERMAIRNVPWFVTNSRGGADFLRNTLCAPAARIRVIHNGVDLELSKLECPDWRTKLRLSNETFVAAMVANLSHYKDHATLLRAWKLVIDALETKQKPGVLLLAGRFDEKHVELKALAYDLELGRSVRFLGYVDDVTGLLGTVDVAVLSSPSEGSPNAILEAMAMGLPVVGTDNSGMREALGPEGNRFLAPTGDADTLAKRILLLAADTTLRQEAGAANRRRIETEFNPNATRKQMASFLAEVLHAKQSYERRELSTTLHNSASAAMRSR